MLLSLAGIPDPVEFAPGAEAIAEKLCTVLTGWPLGEVHSETPFMTVARGRRGYWIERPDDAWRERAPTRTVAVSILIVDVVDASIANGPRLGALHAAAAEFCGRLVLFPAASRAGKSTLMARLAASGHRVFADDLLPIDLDTGAPIATGCLPRLRLPLPDSARPEFKDFVRQRLTIRDSRYGYVEPEVSRQVAFGERAPIGAVVTLSRSEAPVMASLLPISQGEAMLAVLLRDTRRSVAADQFLDDYLGIVGDVPSLRLVYSDLEDAVFCLESAFRAWPESRPDQGSDRRPGPTGTPRGARLRKSPSAPSTGSVRYRRRDYVHLRQVEDSAFLIDSNADDLFHLNALGAAVWNLLDEPSNAASMIGLFRTAFPDAEPAVLDADITGLLQRLVANGLVEKEAENRQDRAQPSGLNVEGRSRARPFGRLTKLSSNE